MNEIQKQLEGYKWQFDFEAIVKHKAERDFGDQHLVLERMLVEDGAGGFIEMYGVRRRDGVILYLAGFELEYAK